MPLSFLLENFFYNISDVQPLIISLDKNTHEYATTFCAGVTRRFHKTPFRGFFLCAGLVDFLHMFWRYF
jgi:hypothetical protein